jgi:hypothetical protein
MWKAADQTTLWMFPPSVFLPDAVMTSILDNFALLDTITAVTRFVEPHRHLKRYPDRLWCLLQELVPECEKIAADRKAENAANRKKEGSGCSCTESSRSGFGGY